MSTDILATTRWPSLAQDLAVMYVPGSPITNIQQILETYGLTPAELKQIIEIPKFKEMVEIEQERFRSQGAVAGAKYRFGTLSQALAEKLYRDANDNKIDAKDTIKLLDLLLKASGVTEEKGTSVNTQVNVGVQLPLPKSLKETKLKHAFPVVEAEVVDGD